MTPSDKVVALSTIHAFVASRLDACDRKAGFCVLIGGATLGHVVYKKNLDSIGEIFNQDSIVIPILVLVFVLSGFSLLFWSQFQTIKSGEDWVSSLFMEKLASLSLDDIDSDGLLRSTETNAQILRNRTIAVNGSLVIFVLAAIASFFIP